MAIKISGTTVIDDSRDINNINTLKVGTAITANAGIITANVIELKGGSFTPTGGIEYTDTALVVGEDFHIYNRESGSGTILRNLIEKTSNVITIGQKDTGTITKIKIIPGSGNGVTELWAGDPSEAYNSIGILTASAGGVTVSGISSVGVAITMYGATGIVSATSVYGKLNNLTYPTVNGTDGYVLTSDGAGVVQWEAAPGAGGGISGITVQEEGSDLATLATTLNFVGDSVTASGTGATKTITISGGGGGGGVSEALAIAYAIAL